MTPHVRNYTICGQLDYTPTVVFAYDDRKIYISGVCIPEDPRSLFQQIYEQLRKFSCLVELSIDLRYFNTPSSKMLLMLLYDIKDIFTNTTVRWITESDDTDIIESGTIYQDMTQLDFIFEIR
jgi:hypothetical protein